MTSLWNGAGLIIRSNGTNTGATLWQTDRDSGTPINASAHDTHDENIADTIERCLNRDAENSPTANINWGGFKITNLGDATAAQDALNVRSLQKGVFDYALTTGSGTAYVATLSPALPSLVRGTRISLEIHTDNTAPPTLDVNTLGALNMRDWRGNALPPGELIAGTIHELWYTGSEWRQASPPEALPGTLSSYSGVTTSTVPDGWLLCSGAAISRTNYARLFALLASTYGGGDGSTTFNLPDLRGRVPAGRDDMGGTAANRLTAASRAQVSGTVLGETGGVEEHQLIIAEIPSHRHWSDSFPSPNVVVQSGGDGNANMDIGGGSREFETFFERGDDLAHTNVQPTIVLNYLIKA